MFIEYGSGLVVESTDGGATWKFVSGSGWPGGGKSWFPFFLDTGNGATTKQTWFAIAQDGGPQNVLVCLSGRGDKDLEIVMREGVLG